MIMTKYYIFKRYKESGRTYFVNKGELGSVHDCEIYWMYFTEGFEAGANELLIPRQWTRTAVTVDMAEGSHNLSFEFHIPYGRGHVEYFMTFDSEEAEVLFNEERERIASRRFFRR